MAFDPDTLIREGVLLASLVILFLLVGLVALVVRTVSLPVCRNCGFQSVRRSNSHHRPWDTFAQSLSTSMREMLTALLLLWVPPSATAFRHPVNGCRQKLGRPLRAFACR